MAVCGACKKSSDRALMSPTGGMLKILRLYRKHYKGDPICQICFDVTKKTIDKVAKQRRQQRSNTRSNTSNTSSTTSNTSSNIITSGNRSREEIGHSVLANRGTQGTPVLNSQQANTFNEDIARYFIRETPPAVVEEDNRSTESVVAQLPRLFTPPEETVNAPQAHDVEEEVVHQETPPQVVPESVSESPAMAAPMPARPRIRQAHNSVPEETLTRAQSDAQKVRDRSLDANTMRRNNGG